ncbi:MAG: diacylglucosamine hydrolase like protein, partial [Sulfurimonas sp.]
YRQDYCGCIFGLTMQRDQQDKLMDEMFSPISNATLPASIEERLAMYKRRMELEDAGVEYKIIREKFLNYRQLNFKVTEGKNKVLPAYALSYSTLPRKKAQGKIEFESQNVHYFNREEIKFISLDYFNELCQTQYQQIHELIFNPHSLEKELKIREIILGSNYDLSPIIVLKSLLDTKLDIYLDTKTYEDVKEKLIIL